MADTHRPPTDDATPATDRSERARREFDRARRNARRVRILKIGLPIVGLIIVAIGAGMTWLARAVPENMTIGATSLEDGRVVMQDPRMSGTDSNDRPYTVTAERALQSLTGGAVDLENLTADVSISSDTRAEIKARGGRFVREKGKLRLNGGIDVATTDGVEISLQSAVVDIDANAMKTVKPVTIQTPSQRIEAGALSVSEGGKLLSFSDGVKMTLSPRSAASTEERRASTRP